MQIVDDDGFPRDAVAFLEEIDQLIVGHMVTDKHSGNNVKAVVWKFQAFFFLNRERNPPYGFDGLLAASILYSFFANIDSIDFRIRKPTVQRAAQVSAAAADFQDGIKMLAQLFKSTPSGFKATKKPINSA